LRSAGAGSSSNSGGAAAAEPPSADDGAEEAPEPAGKKGKGKKKAVPLRDLLASGRTAPGNAWSQPHRTAALGQVPAVAQPKGAWGGKAGGGDKLARRLRATGLGEGGDE
jgi:hypothetical protein